MRTNAIVRIILYTILALVLTGILLVGLGVGSFIDLPHSGQSLVDGEAFLDASSIKDLDIDWAAGSVTIIAADVDHIRITETGDFEEKHALVYEFKGSTLSIDYSLANNFIGSLPSKDLIITVPQDHCFRSLDIDGAALTVSCIGTTVQEMSLDGADLELDYDGIVRELECDGADCSLDITCHEKPSSIQVNGADCTAKLYLPSDCGFEAELNGLGCDFYSDFDFHSNGNHHHAGDKHCKIEIDGLDCELEILRLDQNTHH